MIAPFISGRNFLAGKIIALFLMLMTVALMIIATQMQVGGQVETLAVTEKVTDALAQKDVNYLVLFSGILSIGFSFYLVKLNMAMHEKTYNLALEQVKSMRDLTEQMKDRPCWYPHRQDQQK